MVLDARVGNGAGKGKGKEGLAAAFERRILKALDIAP